MKENTETISNSIFTQCPSGDIRGNQLFQLFNSLKKHALSFKDQMQNGAAALGIGVVFLVTTYFFFIQLAEYGWQ
jgi:hypothetical protein